MNIPMKSTFAALALTFNFAQTGVTATTLAMETFDAINKNPDASWISDLATCFDGAASTVHTDVRERYDFMRNLTAVMCAPLD